MLINHSLSVDLSSNFMFYRLYVGIQYLREFLHLPQEIVPATLKRPQRQEIPRAKPRGGYSAPDPGEDPVLSQLVFVCILLAVSQWNCSWEHPPLPFHKTAIS